MTHVYHEEQGLIFRKLEADTGISYISVPLEELKWVDTVKGLLVRHGNPFTGQCGYYPLSLLFVTPDKREEVALRNQKRPPDEGWVRRTLDNLQIEGLEILH
ncbi:hypothetical protein D3C73_174200 [compost metagenome]